MASRALPATVEKSALGDLYDRLEARHDSIKVVLDHSADPRLHRLADMMFDPQFSTKSFYNLCRECGLAYRDVVEAVREFSINQMLIAGLAHVPAVVEDMAIVSRNQKVRCPRCDGLKVVTDTFVIADTDTTVDTDRPCPECSGAGTLLAPGDKDARKDFLDAMGVSGKKGPAVAVQINNNSGHGSLAELATVASKVLDI